MQDKAELLDYLEQRIEKHIQLAIQTFQNLTSETLLKPASNGGWSIAQCLEHLNSYGLYYLPLIDEELKKQDIPDYSTPFKSTWLGNHFTKLMEPKAGARKFKAFQAHIPSLELEASAVVAEFIQQQETLLKLIRASRTKNLNSIRIPISIMRIIKLNLGDVFQFMIAHNERHIQQALRNL